MIDINIDLALIQTLNTIRSRAMKTAI